MKQYATTSKSFLSAASLSFSKHVATISARLKTGRRPLTAVVIEYADGCR